MPYPATSTYPSSSLFPGTGGGGGGAPVISPSYDLYQQAWRSGFGINYRVDASVAGVPVDGAVGMAPLGGSITDTTKPGVRRVLNLELGPAPGLFDLLAPTGTTLTVTATITYLDRSTLDLPMGVFDVDVQRMSEGIGGISLTAPDKWAKIQRARFMVPRASNRGNLVTAEIAALIRGALGTSETVIITATSTATVGALTWERDRDKAITDLAADIGAWVFFNRDGVATIADLPIIGASSDWLIDATASGVLLELDRERSRADTRNVVVIESSHADGAKFPTQFVWDNDPASPTFAGPGSGAGPTPPATNPPAGAFGIVPFFHDTPVLTTVAAAQAAGRTILARVKGLAASVSLSAVQNPAVDAFDVLDVLGPRESREVARSLERHIADTVTHPLNPEGVMRIDGRSTRSDEYTES